MDETSLLGLAKTGVDRGLERTLSRSGLGRYLIQVRGAWPDLVLLADGGSIGNPGRGYGSFILFDPLTGTRVQAKRLVYSGSVTNNQAEYLTLIEGLKAAGKVRPEALLVLTDSQLLQGQLQRGWRVKAPGLKSLHREASRLLEAFPAWRVYWVPREEVVPHLRH